MRSKMDYRGIDLSNFGYDIHLNIVKCSYVLYYNNMRKEKLIGRDMPISNT